jgi:putative copper resistance protein D
MDAAGIALRLLIYAQSALLLGVLCYALPWARQVRLTTAILAAAGIAFSAFAVVLLASSLSENGAAFSWLTLRSLLTETPAGWAALARIGALTGVAVAAARGGSRRLAVGLAMVAIATLAWNGHGGMTEGPNGWVHLMGDALHLLAGLAWVGAVAAFLWTASRWADTSGRLRANLEKFATTGTLLVALLVITGIANTLFIIGWDGLAGLFDTVWGRLLLLKILLFAGMLGFAAANRFWLTPRLAGSPSLRALRVSLAAEATLGVVVLALVAWLGTLDPVQ